MPAILPLEKILGLFVLYLLLAGCQSDKPATADPQPLAESVFTPIVIPYARDPYQVNGASPWYANLGIGSNSQQLKFGMDTGNNGNWVTSILCNTPACTQPGRTRYDFETSKTFSMVDSNCDSLNFGPWGDMVVEVGQDIFDLPPTNSPVKIMLATNYSGQKFKELDWDGGIGFPSQSPDSCTTWLLEMLVNEGQIDPNQVCVAFYEDPVSLRGHIMLGGYDQAIVDPTSQLRLPFKDYTEYGGALDYLWTTELADWSIGDQSVATNKLFCLDTGASDFKGDTVACQLARAQIEYQYGRTGVYPQMALSTGYDVNGNPGKLVLTKDQYLQEIQRGPGSGSNNIAIDNLQLDDLVLVGSILLESVYSVFWYDASGTPGNYRLTPREMWLFNLLDGPTIIQVASDEPTAS